MPVSQLALLAANAVPLVGVLVLGWTPGSILALFWAETAVIGGYTLLKFWTAAPAPGVPVLARAFLSAFFTVHFGLFMAVHAVFASLIAGAAEGGEPSGGDLAPFGGPLVLLRWLEPGGLRLALLGLVVSHGVSFVQHWWLGGERRRTGLQQAMMQPYPRVIVMHVTVLVGFGGALLLGAPALAIAVLVAVKTGVDLLAHRRQHAAPAG